MFIRADATVDEIKGVTLNGKRVFEVTVSCPDNAKWIETYTLPAEDDTAAAQAAIDRFVEHYAAQE
jgi:hypothetical protein